MEKANVVVKKWGNSFGVVLPIKIINEQRIKDGMEIEITIHPKNKARVKDIFGVLKGKLKKPTEQLMKEVNEELWSE